MVLLLFMLGMSIASLLIYRLARRSGQHRSPYARRPGRSDGVRTVYKRGP